MSDKRILLIVDDDPMIVATLEAALSNSNWDIETANDALQAFMKARDLRPFLIVTDVQMPAYGKGSDMVRALRMEKATMLTPVIVLTGMELSRAKRLLPPDDARIQVFNKPPDFDAILLAIKELTGVDPSAAPPPPAAA